MSTLQEPPPPSERRPTMRDVAERARVSFKTVSRVVNEEGGVSPVLERRVRRAIEELDFRPNVGARILRRADRRTASIGLLLEDVANPYSAALHRAVEDAGDPARGGRLRGQPGRGPGAGAGAGQAVLRPARRRAGAGAGRRGPVVPGGRRCGPAPRSCAWTARPSNLPVDSVLTTNAHRRRRGRPAPGRRGAPPDRLPRRPAHDRHRPAAVRRLPRPRSNAAGLHDGPEAGRARPARRRPRPTAR